MKQWIDLMIFRDLTRVCFTRGSVHVRNIGGEIREVKLLISCLSCWLFLNCFACLILPRCTLIRIVGLDDLKNSAEKRMKSINLYACSSVILPAISKKATDVSTLYQSHMTNPSLKVAPG
jgi:hypothetical protein